MSGFGISTLRSMVVIFSSHFTFSSGIHFWKPSPQECTLAFLLCVMFFIFSLSLSRRRGIRAEIHHPFAFFVGGLKQEKGEGIYAPHSKLR